MGSNKLIENDNPRITGGNQIMLCPYCNKEMTEGYVPFSRPLILSWHSSDKSKKIRISDKVNGWEALKIKNIHYCEDCNVFIKKS